jgi:signal transduction histidine kinase
MQQTDVYRLVRTAARKQAATAGKKRQQRYFHPPKDTSFSIVIDRDRIEQVVTNIISNAVKYTREGGRIDVDVVRDDEWLYIIVNDNGYGISELELSRIFERFYTGNKARSGEDRSTGLGLSISKEIVDQHNGSIDIRSELGMGTQVIISLPIEGGVSEELILQE